MRAAENRMCILDQSECMVLHAECTRMRCSAVESRYVTGFRRPSSMYGKFQLLRADRKICGTGLPKSSVAS